MGSDNEGEKSAQKEKEKKKLLALAPIARPLAGKKLCKRTLKLVRKGRFFVGLNLASSWLLVKCGEIEFLVVSFVCCHGFIKMEK